MTAAAPQGVSRPGLLLYDGVCALCNSSVRFILRHERPHTLRFAPLQGESAHAILLRHPELAGTDSLVWVEEAHGDERALVKSDAVLRVTSYLGGPWRLLLGLAIVPRPVRDFFYDFVARHRYRWFGKHDACPIPPPEVRSRFLP